MWGLDGRHYVNNVINKIIFTWTVIKRTRRGVGLVRWRHAFNTLAGQPTECTRSINDAEPSSGNWITSGRSMDALFGPQATASSDILRDEYGVNLQITTVNSRDGADSKRQIKLGVFFLISQPKHGCAFCWYSCSRRWPALSNQLTRTFTRVVQRYREVSCHSPRGYTLARLHAVGLSNQSINQSINQFNSRLAARGPNSKWNASEIIRKNNKNQNKQHMYVCLYVCMSVLKSTATCIVLYTTV